MIEYNPDGDYTIDTDVTYKDREIVSNSLSDLEPIFTELKLGKPHVHFIRDEDNVGVFINGTNPDPHICLNMPELKAPTELGTYVNVKTTIIHEMGHAYLESIGLDCDLHDEKVEEAIEEYVYEVYEMGNLESGKVRLELLV